jgi:hypothetical protein
MNAPRGRGAAVAMHVSCADGERERGGDEGEGAVVVLATFEFRPFDSVGSTRAWTMLHILHRAVGLRGHRSTFPTRVERNQAELCYYPMLTPLLLTTSVITRVALTHRSP